MIKEMYELANYLECGLRFMPTITKDEDHPFYISTTGKSDTRYHKTLAAAKKFVRSEFAVTGKTEKFKWATRLKERVK